MFTIYKQLLFARKGGNTLSSRRRNAISRKTSIRWRNRIGSYLESLEGTQEAPRATLTLLSCSPNFLRASITRYTLSMNQFFTKAHFDLSFFYHNINVKANVFFFRAKAEKEIYWHIALQRDMDSYRQRQVSQSDCEISSNCGRNIDDYTEWYIIDCLRR